MTVPDQTADKPVSSVKRLTRHDQVVLTVLAVAVGALAGGAAISFRHTIDAVQDLGYGQGELDFVSLVGGLPWWQILLAPALGGLAVGLFIRFFMPNQRPQGVADVMEANALRGGRMSVTLGLKAALASAVSLGCGASVGREGPVVHLGASLGSWVSKRLHLGRSPSRTLLGCGVAAAIATSFNAPIAGTFFALEVVVGHYALTAFAPVVIASVTGTIISRMYYGDFPAFILPGLRTITSFWEFPAFALLGIISAAVAIILMRSISIAEDTMKRTPVPGWLQPALGGLAVGAIGIWFPQVLGVGYEATDAALSERYALWLLLTLLVLKTGATAISLGCGFSGGIFSPTLVIGAMLGGAFGIIATQAFPDLSSGHGAYTIVGMGAVAGAVLGAPISTILMIFELTNDYAITIAVMIATTIASNLTQAAYGHSFFTWQLSRRGVTITGAQDVGLLRSVRASDFMSKVYDALSPTTPIAEVRERLQRAPWGELFVIDENGKLTGVITFSDLHEAAFDTSHDAELIADNVARKRPTTLEADDNLENAVKAFTLSGEVNLPVVDNAANMHLIGVAQEHEIVLAYHRARDRARGEERGGD